MFAVSFTIELSQAARILSHFKTFLSHFKTFSFTLDVVNTCVKIRLEGKQEIILWNSLVEYIRELSGDGNYIVHTGFVTHAPGPPGGVSDHLIEMKIGPSRTSLFTGDEERPPIDALELLELFWNFDEAKTLLMQFSLMFKGFEPLHEKFLSPVLRRRLPRSERLAAGRKIRRAPQSPSPGKLAKQARARASRELENQRKADRQKDKP